MPDDASDRILENRTFEELRVGDKACLSHVVTQRDIDLFADTTGDVNPAHVDPAYAASDMFHHIIIHGIWGAGLISAVLGTKLPGPGTIYLGQNLRFVAPVSLGDTMTASLTVTEKKPAKGDVTLECVCTNQRGEPVITGQAYVRAPKVKLRLPRVALPYVRVERHDRMASLIAGASQGAPCRAAVVFPVDAVTLGAAMDAAGAGLITPILIGPQAAIEGAALGARRTIAGVRLVAAKDAPASAAEAISLVHAGECDLVIKGDLDAETLMRTVMDGLTGLTTGRRISHVYVVDAPDYPRPLLITDAAVNVTPSLEDKAGIVQNAIDLAHVIGLKTPRVAILAAVETITGRLPSTLDAAALCKMADRGQITGGVLDGPLALDTAISATAAAEKGVVSPVAGRADILVVPDLEVGDMLAKQMTFMGGAEAAGLVVGARVPIVILGRTDTAAAHLASCALAVMAARAWPSP